MYSNYAQTCYDQIVMNKPEKLTGQIELLGLLDRQQIRRSRKILLQYRS